MLYVTLSAAPNFDYDDSDPRAQVRVAPKKVAVRDLKDASRACQAFIRQHELGGGNWTGGDVTDAHGQLVAKVSYNGRVWGPDKKEIRLAYSYSRAASGTRMVPGNWYKQTFGAGDSVWFRADEMLKNGGVKGLSIEWRGRTPKAKKDSVPSSFWHLWKEVKESEVPNEIKEAAHTKSASMRSGSWYTQANGLGTLWFRAADQHESGGFHGHIVEWRSRRPHAKTAAVPMNYFDRWVEVEASEVPDAIKSAAGPLRTAAKKPVAEKKPAAVKKKSEPESPRTDGTKKNEVEKAIDMIKGAIDAILDCAPNARDFHEDESYDSKAYAKAVSKHNETVDGLHDVLGYLQALEPNAKD